MSLTTTSLETIDYTEIYRTHKGAALDTQGKAEQLSSSNLRSPSGESASGISQSEVDDSEHYRFTGIKSDSISFNSQDVFTKEQEELEARLAKEYGMDAPDLDADGILREAINRNDWSSVKKLQELYITRTNFARPKEYGMDAPDLDADGILREAINKNDWSSVKKLQELYITRTNFARPKEARDERNRPTEEDILSQAIKSSALPAGSRFWALLIGIDQYNKQPLKGCVNDVELMKEYLTKDLRVPEDHVHCLCDESATRDNIIKALLSFHKEDRINPGGIVIIYFAGYGTSYPDPMHWSDGFDHAIEAICPFDRGSSCNGILVPDISDREINSILSLISCVKGHRITVILDC
ncbi:caspase domain-containing protein, partial [Armillaria novae-zelandiae]